MKLNDNEKKFLWQSISDLMDVINNYLPEYYTSSNEIMRADEALKFLDGEMDTQAYKDFIEQ